MEYLRPDSMGETPVTCMEMKSINTICTGNLDPTTWILCGIGQGISYLRVIIAYHRTRNDESDCNHSS